jgi:trk system potassium uptake protein TrkH
LLILATFIGGCAGSAAGGMKVIRWQLVAREGQAEMRRLVHPSAEVLVKYGDRPVPARVLSAVAGFFAVYLLLFGVLMLALMMTGMDQVSAWSAVATTLNNTGAGLGSVAENFQSLTDTGRWIGVAAMLLGRLEVFTVLVVFTPAFWRR